MIALWLGEVEYEAAWQLQRELAALRAGRQIGDLLLLLEHPPTITLGRAAKAEHLLASPERLARLGVKVVPIDRGGDVTYHGPGQLVGYPIFHLDDHGRDLHLYLRTMEEALIRALAAWSVEARRFPPHTGVWVGDEKIAAIGIKVSRWVCTHGFALNVMPDLSHFGLIVPCGIHEYGVTTLSARLGRAVEVREALSPVAAAFREVFGEGNGRDDLPVSGLTPEAFNIINAGIRV